MNKKLPTDFQQFIYTSRYARWLPEENRRENWEETVDRYINFFKAKWSKDEEDHGLIGADTWDELEDAILNLEVMPSMRALMCAGPALERCNVGAFNCSYVPIDNVRSFDEILYILMCGTGVGFSVERQSVNKLPIVNEHFESTDTTIVVEDSKAGWARGYRELIAMLYSGQVPKWDLSKLRPAGARLKTFGGRSSGPAPLHELFEFTVSTFRGAAGRKLRSIECHDIVCKVGEIVVVGGVRRSALISLSNLSDDRMREAKSGQWWEQNAQRALANNSVAYTEKPDIGQFMKEWQSLYASKSGERGIFNRQASKVQAAKNNRRDPEHEWGTNPCSEIILRPYQFCNLTEVVVRADDSFDSLARKVRIAAILGTLQATLTNFKYLRNIWKKNTEEEALLGVSLTGIMDHSFLNGSYTETKGFNKVDSLNTVLEKLKQVAVETNKKYAGILGVNPSTAITCVKPSGTVSQLTNTASGIHARHSPYYIRTVRGDQKDPLTQFMIAAGIPAEPCVMRPESTTVFSFPIKAPDKAVTRESMTAVEHLNLWLTYQRHWCEHKPSVTITVKEPEWMEVGAWVYKHFDEVSGISFLPYSDHSYQQAPYQEITEELYEELKSKMPLEIDWSKLQDFEKEDTTTGSQDLACMGGVCEVVNIGNAQ